MTSDGYIRDYFYKYNPFIFFYKQSICKGYHNLFTPDRMVDGVDRGPPSLPVHSLSLI